MKRDWDVIRKVLIVVEDLQAADQEVRSDKIEDIDPAVAAYNMRLLYQEGMIEGGGRLESTPGVGGEVWVYAEGLTWRGHELLDSIRSETLWKRVKSTAAEKGLDLTLHVVESLAKAVAGAMIRGG